MPMGDRWRERHRHRHLIHGGDTYTLRELLDGEVELSDVGEDLDPPPIEIQGEPWGWTKGPPFPLGYEHYQDAPGYRDGDDSGAR